MVSEGSPDRFQEFPSDSLAPPASGQHEPARTTYLTVPVNESRMTLTLGCMAALIALGRPGILGPTPVSDEPYETPLPVPLTVRSLKVTTQHGKSG